MTTLLAATFMTFVSIGLAFLFAPKEDDYGLMRILAAWVGATVCAFWLRDNLASLLALTVILGVLAPGNMTRRVYFYMGVLAAVPVSYSAAVPFPGLNYLIMLDYAKVATLVILGPVFLVKMAEGAPPHLRLVDRFLLLFVILTSLISFRELPVTSVVRLFVDQTILIYMPYIAVSRSLKTREQFNAGLKALFVGLCVIAFIGAMSVLRSWNYYTLVADHVSGKSFTEHRFGFLRIYSTLTTSLLGFVLPFGALLALKFRRNARMPGFFSIALFGLFLFVGFVSGSRGGLLAMVIVLLGYFIFSRLNPMIRRAFVYSLVFGAGFGIWRILTDASFIGGDMSNIVYRVELLRASIQQIADYPLFGAHGFRETARFAHLVQGEGIVDIVNSYLEVALTFGLVGLTLWAGAMIAATRGVFAQSLRFKKYIADGVLSREDEKLGALLLALMLAYLVLIFTVSQVSHIPHFGYLILAVTVAHYRFVELEIRKPATSEAAAAVDEAFPDAAPPPEAGASPAKSERLAYGARFVRRN